MRRGGEMRREDERGGEERREDETGGEERRSQYLLDVLLEHTQLEPLVQADLAVLPDVLQPPLVVKNLMHHVQDTVDLRENRESRRP